MPSLQIKPSDIDSLSRKLDEVADVLSNDERALLLAVFKLAAGMLRTTMGGGTAQRETGRSGSGGDQAESGRLAASPAVMPETARTGAASTSAAATMPRLSTGFRDAFQPIIGAKQGAITEGVDVDVSVGVKF
jgi:hypothetical protein